MSGKAAVGLLGAMLMLAGILAGGQALAHDPVEGAGSFIEVGGVADDIEGDTEVFHQYGRYPLDFTSSGKIPLGGYFASERFELRWWDVSDENGRGWTRLALWPATVEYDAAIIGGYKWNDYGLAPVLQAHELEHHDIKLRLHRGELDNMLFRYEVWDSERDSISLPDYQYQRITGQYNFALWDGAVTGQFRQVATSIDAPRVGTDTGEVDSSQLKLNAPLNENWEAYGRFGYALFNYAELPDDELSSSDYTVGLRFDPDCRWAFDANYRYREYPTDNTVTSHVSDYGAYGLNVSYAPDCGSLYEAGYQHKELSYARLNIQDPAVKPLLRGAAVVTPAQVATAITSVSPTQDQYWLRVREQLTDDLLFTGHVEYTSGDTPGTDAVAEGSPSLYYGEQLVRSTSLFYDVTPYDQFAVTFYGQESSDSARGSDLDLNYFEGSYLRCLGGGWLTLAYRDTAVDLDTPAISSGTYTTDDQSYLVNYSQDFPSFSYTVDFSLTDGEGYEEFAQTTAGADIKLKQLGPLFVRVDWFDRNYDSYPAMDSEGVEVGLRYHLDF